MECRSPEQFKEIHNLTKDYKKIKEGRDVPCLDMFSSVALVKGEMQGDSNIEEKLIHIEIAYLEKYYEEITQAKAFGFEDFISGLGGFIGIFLGYSMMQIPQLLGISIGY